MSCEIVKVRCIKHVYPDKTMVGICGLDFVVNKGERVVILGPNGTGKTTLISHILGLLKPIEGEISVFGLSPFKNFKQIRKKIGVVFQNVDEQIIGPTVYDDIAFSLRNEGISKEEVRIKVEEIAKLLGIENLLTKIPHYLSGGQKKKVALAGALSMLPDLLILDEPFDNLDPKSKKEMIGILNRLNEEKGVSTIITTHDINLVPHIADVIYIINEGQIVSRGKPKEIFNKPEILLDANLELPILVQLFFKLKKKGVKFGNIPFKVEEAEEELYRIISNG